jgi:L-lactate dehydrogenase
LTVSRVQEGACGIREVAISLPAVVGRQGVTEIIEPEMSPDEKDGLERSVNILRDAATQLYS